jgi:hypothetical protein
MSGACRFLCFDRTALPDGAKGDRSVRGRRCRCAAPSATSGPSSGRWRLYCGLEAQSCSSSKANSACGCRFAPSASTFGAGASRPRSRSSAPTSSGLRPSSQRQPRAPPRRDGQRRHQAGRDCAGSSTQEVAAGQGHRTPFAQRATPSRAPSKVRRACARSWRGPIQVHHCRFTDQHIKVSQCVPSGSTASSPPRP